MADEENVLVCPRIGTAPGQRGLSTPALRQHRGPPPLAATSA
jgi:hypothetical protein